MDGKQSKIISKPNQNAQLVRSDFANCCHSLLPLIYDNTVNRSEMSGFVNSFSSRTPEERKAPLKEAGSTSWLPVLGALPHQRSNGGKLRASEANANQGGWMDALTNQPPPPTTPTDSWLCFRSSISCCAELGRWVEVRREREQLGQERPGGVSHVNEGKPTERERRLNCKRRRRDTDRRSVQLEPEISPESGPGVGTEGRA
ncbi:unnamed protein product [Arctogadus glacialis]